MANSPIENKSINNNNNLTYLEKKLLENNNIGKGVSFFDKTKTKISFSFQRGYDSEDEHEKEKTDETKEGNNFKYLKILDIRKNEHFGDVYLFLDQPAPLTLKVKSRKAKIFILKKKDALSINNIHHNIMNRIRQKSFRNLISIKKKTLHILKKYMSNELNKAKKTEIQNTSWFNDKSRQNILEGITNFLNNSKNIIGELSPTTNSPMNMTNNKSILKDLIFKSSMRKNNILNWEIDRDINNPKEDITSSKTKPIFNTVNNNRFKQKFLDIKKNNEIENLPRSSKNNLLSLNYEPKINRNRIRNKSLSLNTNFKPNFLKIDKIEKNLHNIKRGLTKKSNKYIKSSKNNNNIKNKSNKKVKFRLEEQKTKSLSKDMKTSTLELYSDTSSQNTIEEERMTTLKDIYNEGENQIRKKIQSSVQKEKILKLCKAQEEIIQSYEKKLSEKSLLNNNHSDINKECELKKVKELNNIIYNKLLEYLDTEQETEVEEGKKTTNKKDYKFEKVSSFMVKSAYSNLNNLTKGKIIINNNYKIDIKNLIKNYINEKNKNRNQMNSFDYLVKNYYNDYKEQDQSPLNKKNTLNKKKVKLMVPHSFTSKNLNNIQDKKDRNQSFTSNKIKKTDLDKISCYRNFRCLDLHDKISPIKTKNWKYQSNISNKSNKRLNNLDNSNTNSTGGFTKFLNSIFSKLKGNEN